MMNYLSLFSGIGGLDLGLDRAGWTCVGQVEIDPFCRRVLAKHWPEVPRHDDVRTCVEWWRGQPRPAVDAVVGGFPCQPVSVAGKQKAQADERWLWPAMAGVIRQLRPQWAVLENVPGLLSRGMGDVLGGLAACGYDAQWDCVPAAAVGAPHLRYRVFVVAHPSGESGWLQPEPESGGCGAPVTVNDGQAQPVAYAESSGWGTGRPGRSVDDGPTRATEQTPRLDWLDPHTVGEGREPRRAGASGEATASDEVEDRAEPARRAWWAAEPDVGRVAYGVPARVDRLRALGNAVVPQVAEHIGWMILEAAQ